MKAIILKDKKISDEQIDELTDGLDQIFALADITPTWYVEERDFAYYPTYEDNDGDIRPTRTWLMRTVQAVYDKYKEDVDHVFIEIHEDNWRSDPAGPGGIWGTAYANVFSGYQVHYCRFDKDNAANSLGTAYHEWMHTHDTFIKTYLNINLNKFLGITNYDREIVHGAHPDAKYIRHKENTEWLVNFGSLLKQAYSKRRELYFNTVKKPLYQQIITLMQRVIALQRQLLNKKISKPTR